MKPFHHLAALGVLAGVAAASGLSAVANSAELVHDSEYYVLEAQNGEAWAADDKVVDTKLAEFRKKNGGQPPNIFYILIDDIGFGDLGIPELNAIRGYKTPAINRFADEGMRIARMYTERPRDRGTPLSNSSNSPKGARRFLRSVGLGTALLKTAHSPIHFVHSQALFPQSTSLLLHQYRE